MKQKPSGNELEILQVLWEKGECSVRDVHEELAKTKGWVHKYFKGDATDAG